ncbi:anti-sigma factor [Oryzihumus sp.]|uniref:anti-sigma factor n=1 Tax=Oryzihumus sp. TaxID=1968903 RepID=UPI002EDB2D76
MNDDIHGLSGAYAVDAVEGEERVAFEKHLAVCSQCRDEVATLRAAAGELAGLTEVTPPPSLRAAVLRDISSVRPLPPVVDQPEGALQLAEPAVVMVPVPEPPVTEAKEPVNPAPDVPAASAAAPDELAQRRGRRLATPARWLIGVAAAALLALAVVWQPWQHSGTPLDATQRVLAAADAQRFAKTLDGARATIVRSPSLRKAVIVADNMPAAPAGHVYEVWLQHKDGTMVKAGLMPEGSQKQVSMVLDGDAAQAVAAGITVEPAGGSDKPTTAPIALFPFA